MIVPGLAKHDDLFIPLIERIERLAGEKSALRRSVSVSACSDQDSTNIGDLLPGSFVYLAEHFGQVKIGFSREPYKRLSSIQTSAGYPLKLIGLLVGALEEERTWHNRIAAKRVRGEWFAYDDELKAAIEFASISSPEEIDLMLLGEDIRDVFDVLNQRGYQACFIKATLQSRLSARECAP